MFKRFSCLLPRLFRRLSPSLSLHVWPDNPNLHTAPIETPIGLPCPAEQWELPQGQSIVHASPVFHINTNPTNCHSDTCKFLLIRMMAMT